MNLIFFRLNEVSTKKGWKTASMRDQPKKILDLFLIINFYFISTMKSIIQTLINTRLFSTFDIEGIHMKSQYSFSFDAKITSIF